MNIHTVAENLRKTIANKEAYLASHIKYLESAGTSGAENMAIYATTEFLKININELKVILHDVEKCCEQWNLMSWEINPERMGQ
jgi:hypothetical protein